MPPLSLRARLYVGAVTAAGAAVVVAALLRLDYLADGLITLLLLVLCCLGDSKHTKATQDRASIGLGSVAVLAAFLLVGQWGAVLTATGMVFAIGTHSHRVKRVFNGAQVSIAALVAGATYTALGGQDIALGFSLRGTLLPFVLAALVHCAVNGALVAGIVSLTQGISVPSVWRGTMAHSVVPYIGYGLFGLLLAVLWVPADVGAASPLLLLLPLVIARWAFAQYAEEQRAYDRTVRTLIAAVETKDLYTRGHSERVSAASVLVARTIGMREDRVASLRYAGMLHDVGKLGVPTRVLTKSGRLDEEERTAIQLHPTLGMRLIREIEFLGEAFDGIYHHHERLDGLGYPMGLKGDQIPEFARVIAVADAFDSMTTTRSYRGARSVEEALAELRRCAGSQFDAAMVEALVLAIEEHGWAAETRPLFTPSAEAVAELPDPRSAPAMAYDHDDPTLAVDGLSA